jgi:outer membrane lipoprotein carrier protein
MTMIERAVIIGCVAGSTLLAADPGSEQLMKGLQDWLDGTRDLQGRFEQTMISGALGSGLVESGRLYLERPGRMRWDYLKPERKIAILDGGKTSLYLAADKEIILGKLEDASDLLPDLLAGEGRIAERFRSSVDAISSDDEEGAYRLRLVPLGEEESFEEVILLLRAPEFAIEAAEVLDAAGNRMTYRFSALRRNRGLAEGIFRFEPPPGTSVLGSH